jgi:P-type Cu+ transporter
LQEPGSGISGVVEGHEVAVGNEAWIERSTGALPQATLCSLRPGATRIFVAVDGQFCGHLDLVDELRPSVVATLLALHDSGITTLMLTGDTRATAIAVGASVGLKPEDIFAGVQPDGKLEKIRELQARGAKVAMVGDGINDTSALAASDVGIAMSGGVQVRASLYT